jgi:protoporphyrinogen oxidase
VELLAGTRVTRLSRRGGRFVATLEGGAERSSATIVSTIPPGVLLRMLDPPPPPHVLELAAGLRFRNLLLVSMVVNRPRVGGANWLYVPDPAVEVARISEFKNMIGSMHDRPDTSLQAEIFCWPDDPVWSAPDAEVVARALRSLQTLGLVEPGEVTATRVLRIPHAYPVFDLGYGARMKGIQDHLATIPGLHVLGRTGAFLYLDQAGCVKQAFEWARTRQAEGAA